jgi:UDP-N-acetylmuramoylalanine--D-glutamate ligase
MDLTNKKIGIWGFGVVGKSALRFLQGKTAYLSVMDKRALTSDEHIFLQMNHVSFIQENNEAQSEFFSKNDLIMASPGIDTRQYQSYKNKLLSELDLFQEYCRLPIIAVTGTVGKTSVTHLLNKCPQAAGKKVICGGNIGVGMLDIIEKTPQYDYVILEVSSFQLAKAQWFAPDVALITNIYPNHLDWHASMQEYIEAKLSMIRRQQPPQKALISDSVIEQCKQYSISIPSRVNQICATPASESDERITLSQNWQLICAAMHALQIPMPDMTTISFDSEIKEHRLEFVTTINGIDFYNDSKSTISQSTLAAVTTLSGRPILLILGGLNKAVDKKADRLVLLKQLPQTVKYVTAFGKEAEMIAQLHPDACTPFVTLEAAVKACYVRANAGDQILLSPGGSSYDLYANYKERGAHFKKIIADI